MAESARSLRQARHSFGVGTQAATPSHCLNECGDALSRRWGGARCQLNLIDVKLDDGIASKAHPSGNSHYADAAFHSFTANHKLDYLTRSRHFASVKLSSRVVLSVLSANITNVTVRTGIEEIRHRCSALQPSASPLCGGPNLWVVGDGDLRLEPHCSLSKEGERGPDFMLN